MMADITKATPRPWQVGWGGGLTGLNCAAVTPLNSSEFLPIRKGKTLVAVIPVYEGGAERAASIVQAVNSFDAMREALQAVLQRMNERAETRQKWTGADQRVYEQAEAALKLAEGEGQ